MPMSRMRNKDTHRDGFQQLVDLVAVIDKNKKLTQFVVRFCFLSRGKPILEYEAMKDLLVRQFWWGMVEALYKIVLKKTKET